MALIPQLKGHQDARAKNGEESCAPVTLPTATSISRLLRVDTTIHLNLVITNAPPTANKGNARPVLIATDKEKSNCNGCNL